MIYNLFGFAEVRIFPLFLVMMSLWRHFLSHGFQICISCRMNYQLAKFQFCRLSLASFIDRFIKTQWWRHFMLLGFYNLSFLKLYIDYHLSKFQISWLSGSNFMEVSVRYQIFPLFLVITSLWRHLLLLSFQIFIFCKIWHKLSAL